MGKTVDCHFWNPEIGLEDSIEFTYKDIGNNIELKTDGNIKFVDNYVFEIV